jgi:hypothetical protein
MKTGSKLATITAASIFALGIALGPAGAQQDSREMVKLPEMMQQHMLANMRDHLVALEEILENLADGKTTKAAEIAEGRLGMSSLSLHGAAHLGKFMPKEMGALGTQMHHAASRFVVAAQNAELEPGLKSQRTVYRALQKVMENCNACHRSYRIR